MKLSGSCFCQALQWEADVNEGGIGLCHCRDCQIFSGSAFRTVGIAALDDFRFTRGEPKTFAKTAENGNVRDLYFCGDCGTHICSMPKELKQGAPFVSIRVATAKEFHQLQPSVELFCASKVDWMEPIESAAQFEGMPVFE